tara:strand:+ start:1031 stop:1264 length:234 start_codon:yes stop_codon:yes gene_type:complete
MIELESRENYINEILGLNDKPREINKNRFGAMIYDHKTAGSCQIMTGSEYSNWKSYQPNRYQKSAVKKAAGKNTYHI